jgi:hypothetical protein
MKLYKFTWGTGTYMLQTAVATGYHEQDALDTLIDYMYDTQKRYAFVKYEDYDFNDGDVTDDLYVTGGRYGLGLYTHGIFDIEEIECFGDFDDEVVEVY